MNLNKIYLLIFLIGSLTVLISDCGQKDGTKTNDDPKNKKGSDSNIVVINNTKYLLIPFNTNPRFCVIYNATNESSSHSTNITVDTTSSIAVPSGGISLSSGCMMINSSTQEIKLTDGSGNHTSIKLMEMNCRCNDELPGLKIVPVAGYAPGSPGDNIIGVIIMNK